MQNQIVFTRPHLQYILLIDRASRPETRPEEIGHEYDTAHRHRQHPECRYRRPDRAADLRRPPDRLRRL